MYLNKEQMINLFLEKIDVSENELDKARVELLKAHRIINIDELNDINKDLLKQNLKTLGFEIEYCKKDASKIVVTENKIFFQKAIDVSFNHNYFILSIYSFNEDEQLYIKTVKCLVMKNVGIISYVKFLNNERLEGERIYTYKREKKINENKRELERYFNNQKKYFILQKILRK